MSDCCNCSTTWQIEEERWSVYSYGLNGGGEYLGAKINPVDLNSTPVGCRPNGKWDFVGEKKNRMFYKRVERLFDRKVRRTLISGPFGDGDCVNVSNGKLIREIISSESTKNYGLENRITVVPNSQDLGTYWEYSLCGGMGARSIGSEEFKYNKQVFITTYIKDYVSNHKCGASCCQPNENIPYIFDKTNEYEKWVNEI
jgi:hypothetical protein